MGRRRFEDEPEAFELREPWPTFAQMLRAMAAYEDPLPRATQMELGEEVA